MGHLEETFLENRANKPELWLRYIDNIFLIWDHPLTEFHTFLTEINSLQERVRFTAEISTESCNFLDLTIYKSPSFQETGILSAKIYYKPTNTFSYPLGSSDIPTHIPKGVAIGEIMRVIRNTISPELTKEYKKN